MVYLAETEINKGLTKKDLDFKIELRKRIIMDISLYQSWIDERTSRLQRLEGEINELKDTITK